MLSNVSSVCHNVHLQKKVNMEQEQSPENAEECAAIEYARVSIKFEITPVCKRLQLSAFNQNFEEASISNAYYIIFLNY